MLARSATALFIAAVLFAAAPVARASAGPSPGPSTGGSVGPADSARSTNQLLAPPIYRTTLWGNTREILNKDGRLERFWIGTAGSYQNGGHLWHEWETSPGSGFNSGAWSLGGNAYDGFCGGISSVGSGNPFVARSLFIFVKGPAGDAVYIHQLWPGGDWSSFITMGGLIKAGAPVYCGGGYGDDYDNLMNVRVLGPDNWQHYKRQLSNGPMPDWNYAWQ